MRTETDNSLAHFGVKGMRWGVRKNSSSGNGGEASQVEVHSKPGGLLKTKGGANHGPHEDAIRAAIAKQKANKSSIDSLSTKELQDLVTRMNLEQQYSRLISTDPRARSNVQKYLKTAIGAGKTVNDVVSFINSPAGKLARKTLTDALSKK